MQIDPLNDKISSLELINCCGSDVDIVNAARVSYGKMIEKIDTKDERLIDYLIKHDHMSPTEHTMLSFRVKCPLFVARQWQRHRIASYNERSYRYVECPLEFYIPNEWRGQDKNNKQSSSGTFKNNLILVDYTDSIYKAEEAYTELLNNGVARELARCVLPACTYTEFIYSTNLRSFMNFIKLRTHTGAQFEIRKYAEQMLDLAKAFYPVTIKAFEKYK